MSTSSHAAAVDTMPHATEDALRRFIDEHRTRAVGSFDFEQFEKDLHERIVALEREALAEELSRHDVDVPAVLIGGEVHHRVLRCEQTYQSAAGPVRVMRTLYSTRADGERAVSPMELRAGIVEGHWSPWAAELAVWVVAHLTPAAGEELFARLGSMTPSKSSLDRLPKEVSRRWETQRFDFEAALRREESIPAEAVAVGVSLDGVMVPMKDGKRQQKRARARRAGKQTKGPAGYSEASCGSLSFYDISGRLLSTLRIARMPEAKKKTLKEMLLAETLDVLYQRPDLKLVKVADGARDNWTYLSEILPEGIEVVDYFHAAEHLHVAACLAYGKNNPQGDAWYKKWRHVLRHDDKGVDKVIRALKYQARKYPRRKKLARELKYFRRNRHRMDYAPLTDQALPIGSGIIEAACKTLVTQRLKCSGMRWRHEGGQAILTFRALVQSDRFDRGWDLLRSTYVHDIEVPENVIPLNARAGR